MSGAVRDGGSGPGEPLRVVMLEDLAVDAELAVRELQEGGFAVEARQVETQAGLRQELARFQPHVLLVDYRVPAFDGLAAIALAREEAPETPVIVVTGSVDEETAVACLKAGAADYVLKGRPGRLTAAVRAAVDAAREREREARALEALRVDEARLNALLELNQRAEGLDEYEVLRLALEDGVRLTQSRFGYLNVVGEDQKTIDLSLWSRGAIEKCQLQHLGHYPLDAAGVWADCVRRGEPVVHDSTDTGFAVPHGHVELVRHVSVPVREDGRVRYILGVANKETTYDQADVRQVILLADAAGRLARRSRAERQLRMEKDRLQAVIENIPIMVVFLDEQGRGSLVNREFERVLGWGSDEASGIDLAAACYPDPAVRERALALPGREERTWREIETRGKDGSLHHVRWSSVRLPGETVIAFGEDVGEKKAAEARLRLLSQAVERSPVMVLITDRDGRIEYVNARFCDVTGYALAEVLGQNPRFLKSGETPPEGYRAMWAQLEAGEAWEGVFHNRRKDGTLFWERALITPIRDDAGQTANYVALKEDITREKAQDEALRRTEAQFLQAQKMEAVGRLAGGVAHDFNNLLGVIAGYAEVLLRAATEEEQSRRLREILGASERAAGLTRQLLAFSRKQVLEPRVIELGALVAESEGMLRRLVGEDVAFHLSRGAALGRVRVDPTQIQQVLLNLVVNARDAMPTGGSLWLDVANAELDAAYAQAHEPLQPGRFVVLAVSDTGVGMDRTTRLHAFEPFYTTKEPGKGTGLGLATVYGIVKQSGGFIWLYSEPGAGTTFKIYFPRVDGEPAAPPPPRPAPRGGSEAVLLVEDEVALGTIAAEMLEMSGYRAIVAPSGFAALALMRRGAEVDLLATDMVMPGMSGRDLADRARQLRPGLRVLFMSGYSEEVVSRHGTLHEGERLLPKPFSISQLLEAVRSALDAAPAGGD